MLRADGPSEGYVAEDDDRDRFWVPALALLACAQAADSVGTAADPGPVATFLDRRDELSYVTADELIEGVASLVVQEWPIVREGGLRFPFDRDPGDVEVDVTDLQDLVDAHRRALAGTGVIPAGLSGRPVQIGDTFAMHVTWQRRESQVGGDDLPVLEVRVPQDGSQEGSVVTLGGLDGVPPVPIMDISWDAREQGKLAYWAAMAQPLRPDGHNWDTTQRDLATSSHLARLAGGSGAPGPPSGGQAEREGREGPEGPEEEA